MMLFKQSGQARKIGTIVRRSATSGLWIVSDCIGREMLASSGEQWQQGDSVAIVGGEIVGRAGKQPATKIYEV